MNMINIFCEYIKYQLNAKRMHGIHSPFVYNFGDKCLKSTVSEKNLSVFGNLRTSYLKDQTSVQINSLLTPSDKPNPSYSIQQITKMFAMNKKFGKLLFRITSHYPVLNVLELGTGNGLGTYMLTSGNKKADITTVEENRDLFNYTKSHFTSNGKVTFINDSFSHYLNIKEKSTSFDFVLINGNQWNIDSIKETLTLLESVIHDETIILINGIRQNKGLFETWKKSMNMSNYHLSIDLFRVGILLQRHHQQKEHFVIRY